MTDKILFVDDDLNLLAALQRILRKRFLLETALGGIAGLEMLARQGPFAVVVADLGMPGMNGAEFLRTCREKSPDTVRIMLTGDTDQEDALEAARQLELFRVLGKPCPNDILINALEDGLHQYHLATTR